VTGNPTELREVLTNLLKNALDALADRGGLIMVQVEAHADGIEIRVHDDGAGIPPEIMAKVFDPFFTTKGEGGTGLGLCLSQRIAEQHGGELTLDSSPGSGTTATLRLPLHAPAALPDGGSAPGPAAQLAEKSVRILIVDDDSDVLRPLCSYLERSGYTVAAAKDAFDALEQMRAETPDVLLTDIGMPSMDGLELCRRAMALRPDLPVVLMSGWASDVDPAKARAAGAQALLAKPFAMQQVAALLRKIAAPSPSPDR
jgi:CheY-like chemotaxis protein/anti-sigma regulatory factor (Ser/Thr protein kinase)